MRSVRGDGVIPVQRAERDIHTAGGKLHFPENAFLDEIHGSVLSWYCVLRFRWSSMSTRTLGRVGPVGSPAKIFGIGCSDKLIIDRRNTQTK